MGGKFMVGVPPVFRKGAGVAAGEMVDVDLELDDAPREVAVPADFAAALDRNAKAKKFFAGLSTAPSCAWLLRSTSRMPMSGRNASPRPSRS